MSQPINVGTPSLSRGSAVKLGVINATSGVGSCIQFTIPEPTRDNQGFILIQTVGTAGTNPPTLEVSIDGGNTWGVFSGSSSTIVLGVTGQLAGDAAAASMDAYQVSGMGAGALFRFGWTAGTPNATVWGLAGLLSFRCC